LGLHRRRGGQKQQTQKNGPCCFSAMVQINHNGVVSVQFHFPCAGCQTHR
jgi:hypothetical protein